LGKKEPVVAPRSIRASIAVTTLFALLASLTGCSDDKTVSAQTELAAALTRLPEGKLAAIDSGTINVTEAMVSPYKLALDSLQGRCSEPRDRLGDFAVVGVEELNKKAVSITILRFLEMMVDSIPPEVGRLRCAEIAASLVVLTDRP